MPGAEHESNPPRRRDVAALAEFTVLNTSVSSAVVMILGHKRSVRQKIVVRICGKDGIGPPLDHDQGSNQLTIILDRAIQIGGSVRLQITTSRMRLFPSPRSKKPPRDVRFLQATPPPSKIKKPMSFIEEIDARRRGFRRVAAAAPNDADRAELCAAFEFMTHLEVLTAQDSLLGDVVIPQRNPVGAAKNGSRVASNAEARLLQFLRRRLDQRIGALPSAAIELDRAALEYYSPTFIHTVRRHFEIDGKIDTHAVDRTFALFAGGFLRSTPPDTSDLEMLRVNCEPDSSFYLYFAELGLLSAEERIERDAWIQILPGIVATLPILFAAYGGPKGAPRTLETIRPIAFRPVDRAELEAARTRARLLREVLKDFDAAGAIEQIAEAFETAVLTYLGASDAEATETAT